MLETEEVEQTIDNYNCDDESKQWIEDKFNLYKTDDSTMSYESFMNYMKDHQS